MRCCVVFCCFLPCCRTDPCGTPTSSVLTSVLGEQDGEGALFQQADGVVLLREWLDAPVIGAIHVPRLRLVMLQQHTPPLPPSCAAQSRLMKLRHARCSA